jgi:IS30 family transposase
MIKRYKVKNPLTLEERKKIKEGLESFLTFKQIADTLGRAKSTVLRESKRLGRGRYDPVKAHKDFRKKQMLSGIKRGSPLYLKILEMEIEDDEDE